MHRLFAACAVFLTTASASACATQARPRQVRLVHRLLRRQSRSEANRQADLPRLPVRTLSGLRRHRRAGCSSRQTDIADIADKFVRVRLVKIAGMDLRRFEFDYDLNWFAFFLNADETIYGRYGGRDASERRSAALLEGIALRDGARARQPTSRRPQPVTLAGKPTRAEDFAAAKSHRGCIHCHNVNEFRRADLQAAGKWDRDSIWVYPLPENVGLTLDVDAGRSREGGGAKGSAADRAGLKPGDRLDASSMAIRSRRFADAMFALHKAPKKGTIAVSWLHDGKERGGNARSGRRLAEDQSHLAALDARHPPLDAVQRRRPDCGREEERWASPRSAPRSARMRTFTPRSGPLGSKEATSSSASTARRSMARCAICSASCGGITWSATRSSSM